MKTQAHIILSKSILTICTTAFLIIIVLAIGGPFVNPLCPIGKNNIRIKYLAGDNRVLTSAGQFNSQTRVFLTDNKSGALVYGPYVALEPGHYSVSWHGKAHKDSNPKFEIFSSENKFLKSEIGSISATALDNNLKEIDFKIDRGMNDVEFRVMVDASDNLEVQYIILTVVTNNP